MDNTLGTKRRMVKGLSKLIVEKNLTNVRMRLLFFCCCNEKLHS